jgi:hypothetical protein
MVFESYDKHIKAYLLLCCSQHRGPYAQLRLFAPLVPQPAHMTQPSSGQLLLHLELAQGVAVGR